MRLAQENAVKIAEIGQEKINGFYRVVRFKNRKKNLGEKQLKNENFFDDIPFFMP